MWVLFLAYAACFGVELTIYNIATIYYHDQFGLSVAAAGVIAGLFGLTNLFARALGGNAVAVAVGFLFREEALSTQDALTIVGISVIAAAALVFLVRFARPASAERRYGDHAAPRPDQTDCRTPSD